MTEEERNLDLTIAELEQENRLLRARNERLEKLGAPMGLPDKLTTKDGEHPEYIAGWNDCREMMIR